MPRFHALFSTLLFVPSLAFAQNDGSYDPRFAGAGLAVFGYQRAGNPVNESGRGVGVRPDGTIVIGGNCVAGGAFRPCAAQRLRDGAPDPSFGPDGDGLSIFGNEATVTDLFLMADGRAVLCGYLADSAWVGRLTQAGLPDTSATGAPLGYTTVTFPSGLLDGEGIRCAEGGGSSIYIGATVDGALGNGSADLGVARVNANLQLDGGFSNDGIAVVAEMPASLNYDRFGDIAVSADGGPVLVGYDIPSVAPADSDSRGWEICALQSSGAPRAGFGVQGCRSYQANGSAFANREFAATAVALDAQGRILVAGVIERLGGALYDGGVARFLLDGNRDPTFNGGESALLPSATFSLERPPRSTAATLGGRILVAGPTLQSGNAAQLAVVRILGDGSAADASFGSAGVSIVTDGVNAARFGALALQIDRPVVAGTIDFAGGPSDFVLVRLVGDPLFADGFESP